jgi:hypothetical protein
MKTTQKQKIKQITEAKMIFLKYFPIQEIDNEDVKLICKSYRKDNSSLISCLVYLDKHDEYLYEWYKNNKLCNVFYFRD